MANYTDVESITLTLETYGQIDSLYYGSILPFCEEAEEEEITPPVVTFITPGGTTIESDEPVEFEVTDNLGSFAKIIVIAWYQSTGVQELIHDGDNFTGYFSEDSSRVVIAYGYRYSVLRLGGWENAPTIRVIPIDSSGNVG